MVMQIKRNILGTEVVIDLTDGEILDAHYEAERYNAREMLSERLMQEENIIDDIPAELFGKMVDEVMKEKDALDGNMGSNIFPAMSAVIEKHRDELKKEDPWKLFDIVYEQTKRHTFSVKAKNEEDAERRFNQWKDNHTYEFDDDMADEDVYDDEILYTEESTGNPDYADISEEEE